MNTPRKRTKTDIILNLMIMSGFTLLLCTVPEGIVIALQARYRMGFDFHDAMVAGGKMMLLMALTGYVLKSVGFFLLKRYKRRQRL